MKWITRPATLDVVNVRWEYADTPTGLVATVHVEGRCLRKRGTLWTHTETLAALDTGYGLSDLMCHLAMALTCDRPARQQHFERSMVGESWDQPELPF